ncbi:hypothetical protein BGP77_05990 [Saccharospirillum sp. MSK14-1]|uniref:hypothetical protein n=1 Tax=Saccharospirillum sp. MSK14-1 TaxID=1897632 RepID=UPI000D37BF55|nr:hypothetical protein [Saccharospirillum sp. MSK14-1]PTY36835.1 hypothetical protein BGP77_05990 [Saccharospirillum sp. MSK14-1]
MHRWPLIGFLFLLQSVMAADWQNPAERYQDAYQAYVSERCPLPNDGMSHYAYFARDREAMRDHPFLEAERFEGAQIMYSWRDLEPERDHYDFEPIRDDLVYLAEHGKTLFIQLQDATFYNQNLSAPDYLRSAEFDGGMIQQYTDDGTPEGWVAKRWNAAVRERFAALMTVLGDEFDGDIAGINLQETAIGVSADYDSSFTPAGYVEGLKANMQALADAFPNTIKLQYANFMPGEWLPWEDKGYLRSIYEHGNHIGVGLGGPDLMVRRKGQLNHTIAMMHEGEFSVPLGIAVQDGNYIGATNSDRIATDRANIVPLLHAFAADFMGVSLMFWSYQEPYFSEDVLPCVTD